MEGACRPPFFFPKNLLFRHRIRPPHDHSPRCKGNPRECLSLPTLVFPKVTWSPGEGTGRFAPLNESGLSEGKEELREQITWTHALHR